MKLVGTIVEVPREWLYELPEHWKMDVYEIASNGLFEECRLGQYFADDDGHNYTYHVEIPAGEGLPMELAPKEPFVWIQAFMGGGFPVAVTWDEDGYWHSFRSAGRDVDERMGLQSWLPLPVGSA